MNIRQDNLMAQESPEGRPPTHKQRTIGWSVLLTSLGLVLAIGIIIALSLGVSLAVIVGVSVVLVFLTIAGGWPVVTAGLHRGHEEAVARSEAIQQVKGQHNDRHWSTR